MKNKIFCILAVLLMAVTLQAQSLSATLNEIVADQQWSLALHLDGVSSYTAIQAHVLIPDVLQVSEPTQGDVCTDSHSTSFGTLEESSYSYATYSPSSSLFNASGTWLTLPLSRSGEYGGTYTLCITNIIISDIQGVEKNLPDQSVTITLSGEEHTAYAVNYYLDGELYHTDNYAVGDIITPLPDLTREGYTFSGWSTIPTVMPSHDVTVEGSFTVNQYTVTFLNWDSTVLSSELMDYGTVITMPNNPRRTGYSFSGWDPEVPETVPANDVTFTAQFSINQYTITFKDWDGSVIATITADYGAIITAPTPEREGYTFTGWNQSVPTTMPNVDLTRKARYSINQYTVTFMDWDDTVIYQRSLNYGTTIPVPSDPYIEGYTFNGWNPSPDATVPAHDVTYKATYVMYDAIDDIHAVESNDDPIYTLSGMRVINPRPGIYIRGGKKIVIK